MGGSILARHKLGLGLGLVALLGVGSWVLFAPRAVEQDEAAVAATSERPTSNDAPAPSVVEPAKPAAPAATTADAVGIWPAPRP